MSHMCSQRFHCWCPGSMEKKQHDLLNCRGVRKVEGRNRTGWMDRERLDGAYWEILRGGVMDSLEVMGLEMDMAIIIMGKMLKEIKNSVYFIAFGYFVVK